MKKSPKQKLKEECVKLATAKKLKTNPNCAFCFNKATTCHHWIHQARSNYLRCDSRNLIPICATCHYKLHNGYEQIFTARLIWMFGKKWADDLIKDSQKTIHDNLTYWRKLKIKLLANKLI